MRRIASVASVLLCAAVAAPAAGEARSRAPLHDATYLNIGLGCQWQQKCIARQQKAKNSALKYVRKHQPPTWRIHLCNRNASRSRYRVDWIGFNNCIRNAVLRPAPVRTMRKAPRRITQGGGSSSVSRGERG